MNILGVNAGFARPLEATPTGHRHTLSDGSAALLIDGRIVFAGIEERHTRKRYAGGFGDVVHAFWESESGSDLEKIDVVALSTCCGPKWIEEPQVKEEIQSSLPPGIWSDNHVHQARLVVVDHHESHASLGFALSGCDRALVAVIDGYGNLLDDSGWSPAEWWRGFFQRHSYYVAQRANGGFSLSRIDSDAEGRDDVGLGEAYRALTHFCGWNSYQQAGSTMALAAFGDPDQFRNVPFIWIEGGHIRCGLPNDHVRSEEAIATLLRRHGHAVSPMRHRTATPEDPDHCSVVCALQNQLTEAICTRLLQLAEEQRTHTIVVSGGVAMNCLAMGELQRRFDGKVFVPPAPSDTGQGLGNAVWASSCIASPCFTPSGAQFDPPQAPFWGVPGNEISHAIKRIATHHGLAVVEGHSEQDQYRIAAQALAEGRLVAISMGRSEYGPRALGRRSVLADPRDPQSPLRVNQFKRREAYRPFAPAILLENVKDYFEWQVESPFMSFAVKSRPGARERIPAVIHADGTARIQTVAKDSHSPLRPILEYFHLLTGVPLLINTSFNRKGEPMVETPAEAAAAFIHSQLDLLLLDGVTIQRTEQP